MADLAAAPAFDVRQASGPRPRPTTAGKSGLRDLETYGQALRAASDAGQQLFALYGGFFSVLMAGFGLRGSSHGIGYGESRAWIELPQSGPPPPRYYLPRAHRYISQDLALLLWRTARDLVFCECVECRGQTPAALDYRLFAMKRGSRLTTRRSA